MAKKPASTAKAGAKQEAKQEVTIAEASGTASSSVHNPALGKMIEEAMTDETEKCFAEGVTNPDEIRDRKLARRQKVRDEVAAEQAKATAAAQKNR